MYVFSQLAFFLFTTFLLGIAAGYALWRTWGEREVVAKYNQAELRLAAHVARLEQAAKFSADAGQRDAQAAARSTRGGEPVYSPPPPHWDTAQKRDLQDLEAKSAMLIREAEDAVRKAEAAAEKKIADFANKMAYDAKPPPIASGAPQIQEVAKREAVGDPQGVVIAMQAVGKGD